MASIHKKLVNTAEKAVDDSIDGFVASSSGITRLSNYRVIYRDDVDKIKDTQVTLLSGGGSGHEPAHAGFIGDGMLTCAVAGDIFASPSPASILAGIRAICGKAGTLVIVKNYTGDRLNFGIALETARSEGLKVDMVICGEDCAIEKKGKAGRRGLCGTLLVHKLAGAAARQGRPLEEIVQLAEKAIASMGTMGVALSACSLPGKPASFSLGSDEVELGLGIHGEAGARRDKLGSATEITQALINTIIGFGGSDGYMAMQGGEEVGLVVNNLGSTTTLELGIVAKAALDYLVNEKKLKVTFCAIGTLMTSLEMAGVSITLVRLWAGAADLLREPTRAPAWPHAAEHAPPLVRPYASASMEEFDCTYTAPTTSFGKTLAQALRVASEAIIAAEPQLTEMDRIVGDGDCGLTLKEGASAILDAVTEPTCRAGHLKRMGFPEGLGLALDDPKECALGLSKVVQRAMGGTSGALYRIFFSAIARFLAGQEDRSPLGLAKALKSGWDAISKYGGAVVGDRTMVDAGAPSAAALVAALEAGKPLGDALADAAAKADAGASATATMHAEAGRSSYISEDVIKGTCDPGAKAVALWMDALRQVVAPSP